MTRRPRVLAVASGGGHWVQLFRLRRAWDDCDVTYMTTDAGHRPEVERDAGERGQPSPGFVTVVEANRWEKLRLVRLLAEVTIVVARLRPDAVVTTGAAPGYLALRIAHLLGARTAWVDSIANGDELSLSGRMAGRHADLWLTQWPDLATPDGPQYRGAVL